ncbi:lectin [Kutzneria chonburiensis]|uniref:lectin n=1 Tax=Kutzneria chonburiensis TaxID=1483604 RepID=UPI002362077A|nr:lectin [Kutzneria chonburiensis]
MRTRHLTRTFAVAAAAIAVAALGVPTAQAATGTITGYGGKCVDVTGGTSANGTRVQLWTCTGGPSQQWTTGDDGSLRALGKCLDVAGGSTLNGAKVQIYDCNGTAAQRWTSSGGQLVNAGSGKCLDATGVSSADGTPLQIWTCGGGANQQWTLPATTTLRPAAPARAARSAIRCRRRT